MVTTAQHGGKPKECAVCNCNIINFVISLIHLMQCDCLTKHNGILSNSEKKRLKILTYVTRIIANSAFGCMRSLTNDHSADNILLAMTPCSMDVNIAISFTGSGSVRHRIASRNAASYAAAAGRRD